MHNITLITLLLVLMTVAYRLGSKRSRALAVAAGGVRNLHSLPAYYGFYAALWSGLPALLVLFLWNVSESVLITRLVVEGCRRHSRACPPHSWGWC